MNVSGDVRPAVGAEAVANEVGDQGDRSAAPRCVSLPVQLNSLGGAWCS